MHTTQYIIPGHKVAHHIERLKQCKRMVVVTYCKADSAEMLSGMLPVNWLLPRDNPLEKIATCACTRTQVAYMYILTVHYVAQEHHADSDACCIGTCRVAQQT